MCPEDRPDARKRTPPRAGWDCRCARAARTPPRAWAPPLAPSSMKTYLLPRPREAIGVRSLVRYAIGKACARDDRFSVVHVARASRRVADARVRLRRYARARVVVITNSRCHPSRAMHSECTHTHRLSMLTIRTIHPINTHLSRTPHTLGRSVRILIPIHPITTPPEHTS